MGTNTYITTSHFQEWKIILLLFIAKKSEVRSEQKFNHWALLFSIIFLPQI